MYEYIIEAEVIERGLYRVVAISDEEALRLASQFPERARNVVKRLGDYRKPEHVSLVIRTKATPRAAAM